MCVRAHLTGASCTHTHTRMRRRGACLKAGPFGPRILDFHTAKEVEVKHCGRNSFIWLLTSAVIMISLARSLSFLRLRFHDRQIKGGNPRAIRHMTCPCCQVTVALIPRQYCCDVISPQQEVASQAPKK